VQQRKPSTGTFLTHPRRSPPNSPTAVALNLSERESLTAAITPNRYRSGMPLTWSPIHTALGEAPVELSIEMIKECITQGIVESDDLDWKEALPGREEPRLAEFSKDVAAMANTRGGVIVYGVEEERGKGAAKAIKSVDISEGSQRRLRQLAWSRIEPIVSGIGCIPLSSQDGSETVLVLSIPRSPDAPHFIGRDKELGVPFRNGPETLWMRERDIERAYRDRFTQRETADSQVLRFAAGLKERLVSDETFLIGLAVPRTPLPRVTRGIDRAEVAKILERALARALEVAPENTGPRWFILRDLGNDAFNPAVGFRSWVAQNRSDRTPSGLCDLTHVELHHDGSMTFAASMKPYTYGIEAGSRHPIPTPAIEGFAADFVALADTYMRSTGAQGTVTLRMDITRQLQRHPLAAFDLERLGSFTTGRLTQPHWSRSLNNFRSVSSELSPSDRVENLRSIACDLAEDTLHQFGIEQLHTLHRDA
jgi:hypothetical protein